MLEGDTPYSRIWREQIDPAWNIKPREALQKIGTSMFREQICDDFWVKGVEQTIYQWAEEDVEGVVVTDCRFENEMEMIKRNGGILLHLSREKPEWAEEAANQEKPEDKKYIHVTDWNVWRYMSMADIHILNNGTKEELYAKVLEAISK